MEITDEIKAKVFAQYLGQYIQCDSEYHGKKELNEKSLYSIPPCKLILKPLSAITDEDAIEVAKLFCEYNKNYYPDGDYETTKLIIEDGKDIIFNGFSSREKSAITFQLSGLLISKGYDLPNHLLGGQTLHEAGLAIYETEL